MKKKLITIAIIMSVFGHSINANNYFLPVFIKNYNKRIDIGTSQLLHELLIKKPLLKTSKLYNKAKNLTLSCAIGATGFLGTNYFSNNKVLSTGVGSLLGLLSYKLLVRNNKIKHEQKTVLTLVANWPNYKFIISDQNLNNYFGQLYKIYQVNPKAVTDNAYDIVEELKNSINLEAYYKEINKSTVVKINSIKKSLN